MVVVLIQCTVKRDAIALEQKILQCVDTCETKRFVDSFRKIRIVKDDVEAECLCSQCNRGSHSSYEKKMVVSFDKVVSKNVNRSSLTEANDTQCVASDSSTSRSGLTNLFWTLKLFAISHHVSEPISATVQI